jgi:hypothetical protein
MVGDVNAIFYLWGGKNETYSSYPFINQSSG